MTDVEFLSDLASLAAPPAQHGNRAHVLIMPARDGWQVGFFYSDRGEFGYLDHFIAPNGEPICPWTLPSTDGRRELRRWAPPRASTH